MEETKINEETVPALLAGYAEAVVTPPMGVNIPGYFSVRISDGIITDLHIRAAAFALGETKAIFFSCEAVGIKANAADRIRALIAERCGIPVEAVYISCNHSHTAFRITVPGEKNSPNDIFLKRLYQQFCDTAQFAFEDLKPATLRTALGKAEKVGFKRRYYMKDGTTRTNPKLGSPDIAGPVGEQDESVRLIRIVREGAKEILMVCYGTHADTVGGTKYCADYSGYLTEDLKGAFLGEAEVLFFNGCEGDSGSLDRKNCFPALPKGPEKPKRMGRILAGEVLKIYDDAVETAAAPIETKTVTVKVGKNPYDPADVPVAREMKEIYLRVHDSKSPELEPYKGRLNLPEAMRIMANLDRPEFFELHLTLLRLGDIAFVGIPGEPFQDIGIAIKEKSPFKHTVVTACTNGHEGYYPTAQAFSGAGYERSTSPYAWDVAEKIEKAALEGLNELYQNK